MYVRYRDMYVVVLGHDMHVRKYDICVYVCTFCVLVCATGMNGHWYNWS